MDIPKHVNWPGWDVVRRLGAGSFGAVYEIERDLYGKTEYAALKVISIPQDKSDIDELYTDGYDKESITLRFRSYLEDIVREYAMMAEMKGHANIVYCDDLRQVQHEDGIGWDIYIKMELLTPLVQVLPVDIPEEQVIRLGVDICNALVLCKQRNIIHRDIKPQNIFVSRDGNYKLGDFGIAKTAEKTSGGTKTGTYKYMAPEVYKAEPYGTSVDIYSLGLVLYWMLNERRTPFLPLPPKTPTTYQEEEAKNRRFAGEPLPPPAHGSPELQAIVLKACAHQAKDRFKSAAEMLEALQALLQDDKAKLAVLVSSTAPAFMPTGAINENTVNLGTRPIQNDTVGMWHAKPQPSFEGNKSNSDTFANMPVQATAVAQVGMPPRSAIPTYPPQTAQEQTKKKKPIFWIWIAAVLLLCIGVGLIVMRIKSEQSDESQIQLEGGENNKQTTETVSPSTTPTTTQPTETESVEKETLPVQTDWSEWSESLPDYVTEADYDIQTQTLYSSRRLETTTSTQTNKMDGWELYDTANGNGDFGPWSDWSQNAVSGSQTREVQNEVRYRASNKETKTSSSSSMSGWELYDTTYAWSSYGRWSDWSTSAASGSNSRKVETKTQYRYRDISYTTEYTPWGNWSEWQDWGVSTDNLTQVQTRTVWGYYYFLCPYCGVRMHGWGSCYTWAGGCGRKTDDSGWRVVWSDVSWDNAGLKDWHGTGKYYTYINGELVFKWPEGGSKTQYRYSTRSTYQQAHYGNWSSWSDSSYSNSSTREVESRTVYRYCDRSQVATYHFYRWGDWGGWSTNAVSSNNNRKVETATFYRYRDRTQVTTYYFRRWTDWSDYTSSPVDSSGTVEVKTVTRYSYKSK